MRNKFVGLRLRERNHPGFRKYVVGTRL
jgi:hypothetical protein